MEKVVVFGGGGYCGAVLVPQLAQSGFSVTVFDTFWYGQKHLQDLENVSLVTGDVRDIEAVKASIDGAQLVLHLACISNDSSFHLDEKLSTTVNYDSFSPVVKAAKNAGVRRFVFASSSSVYGVSDQPDVTEDHPLVPLTLYNKYKGLCEPLLLDELNDEFTGVVFRPATVCGYSERLRLDLSVNILTHHAYNRKRITVFGGDQLRPNLHIQDYSDLCRTLLQAESSLVNGEVFNCGYENMTIMQIASEVKTIVEAKYSDTPVDIEITESDDNRSYHINSDKIKNVLGFVPKYSVGDAIEDLCEAFAAGKVPTPDDIKHYNVKTMVDLGVN
jgi:nucleoside-diphosphate-sugar epimerase